MENETIHLTNGVIELVPVYMFSEDSEPEFYDVYDLKGNHLNLGEPLYEYPTIEILEAIVRNYN